MTKNILDPRNKTTRERQQIGRLIGADSANRLAQLGYAIVTAEELLRLEHAAARLATIVRAAEAAKPPATGGEYE